MSPSRNAKANFSLDFSLDDSNSNHSRLEMDLSEEAAPTTPSQDANYGSSDNIFTLLEKMERSPTPPQQSDALTEQGSRTPLIEQLQSHPCFLNSDSIEEASKQLEIVGNFYILPDPGASNHAILLWKVGDEAFQNVKIKEVSDRSETCLVVKGTKYSSLDEVLQKFLDPLVHFTKEIQSFKYYSDIGSLRKVADNLMKQKKKEPSKIHYVLSPSSQHPGNFVISFLPKTECKHEFIVPRPEGLQYRHKIFSSLKKLLAYHKEDPLGTKTPQNKSSQKQGGGNSLPPQPHKKESHPTPTTTQHHKMKKNKIHVELVAVAPDKKRKDFMDEASTTATEPLPQASSAPFYVPTQHHTTTAPPTRRRKKTRWDNPGSLPPQQQQNNVAEEYLNNTCAPPLNNFVVPPPPLNLAQCMPPPFNPSMPPPMWTANFN